jgi:hypothetical protein
VEGEWTLPELDDVKHAVQQLAEPMGGALVLKLRLGGVEIEQKNIDTPGSTAITGHYIALDSAGMDWGIWTVAHELSHAWDANYLWELSQSLEAFTGGFTDKRLSRLLMLHGICDVAWNEDEFRFEEGNNPGEHGRLSGCNSTGYFYGDKPSGSNWNFTRKEDFAESVVMYIGWNSSDQELRDIAHSRIDRYTLPNGSSAYGGVDNWSDYAKYFYPTGGLYEHTKRWQFVDDLMKGNIYPIITTSD